MSNREKKHLFSLTNKDFEISYFSGSGAGGQHRNRHLNCVRIKHPETGIIKTGQNQRSLQQNKTEAFRALVSDEKFKQWLHMKAASMLVDLQEVESKVEKLMNPENLKIEAFNSAQDRWEPLKKLEEI